MRIVDHCGTARRETRGATHPQLKLRKLTTIDRGYTAATIFPRLLVIASIPNLLARKIFGRRVWTGQRCLLFSIRRYPIANIACAHSKYHFEWLSFNVLFLTRSYVHYLSSIIQIHFTVWLCWDCWDNYLRPLEVHPKIEWFVYV